MPEYLVRFTDGSSKTFHAAGRDSAEKMARKYSRENLRDRRFSHDKSEVNPNIASVERTPEDIARFGYGTPRQNRVGG